MNPQPRIRIYFILCFLPFLITPAKALSYYWVGNGGDWSDYANHWVNASGGNVFYSQEPTINDDVFFDANSFTLPAQAVQISVIDAYCHSMSWAGVTNLPGLENVPGNTIHFGGSLLLDSGMIMQDSYTASFESTSPGNFIDLSGLSMSEIIFNGAGGGWTLQSLISCSRMDVRQGNLYTAGYEVGIGFLTNYGSFISNSGLPRGIFLGNSTLDVGDSLNLDITGLNFDGDSSLIYMLSSDSNYFNGADQHFGQVLFRSGGRLIGNNIFSMVSANLNFRITGSNTFDTLFLNNTGYTVTLESGLTQTINKLMEANTSPGYELTIKSSIPGVQAMISLAAGDTICMNNIILVDQLATGGGIFYAGANSTNQSNNSGWQFSDCTPALDAVWPGDTNDDLIVDNADLLNVGLFNYFPLYPRPGGSSSYTAQYCMDYFYQTYDSVNIKHADCNGDGWIDVTDTISILVYYGQTHPARLAHPPVAIPASAPDLYFQVPPTFVPGATVSIPVQLGTSANPVANAYGIAFTVDYDSTFIVPGSFSLSFTGSWLIPAAADLHLLKEFPNAVDIAFTRIDQLPAAGYGTIALLQFTIDSNATGWSNLGLSNIHLISSTGMNVPVNPVPAPVYADVDEISAQNSFTVFPNPAENNIHVFSNGTFSAPVTFTWTDISGRIISTGSFNSVETDIDISNFAKGSYLLTLSGNETSVYRIVKQ